jgi:AGCS family alanine or glycine:cation symporter
MLETIVQAINGVIWSPALVFLCLGSAIFFSVYLKFPQFRFFKHGIKATLNRKDSDAGISPFQSFCTSVGAKVGMGNIAGVATAIFFGGPGAVFWMWLSAILGAAAAFAESSLAQAYKILHSETGEYVGGPFYFIEKGLKIKWLAVAFALATILGPGITMCGLHTNSVASVMDNAFGTPWLVSGAVFTFFLGVVVCGGIKRIGKVSEPMSIAMCIIYIIMTIVVAILRFQELPGVFAMIFKGAFGLDAAFAGIMGSTISWGIKRGVYSNEAGQGSGAIMCAPTETSHPAAQGVVQILSVFMDTLVICSASAIIILCSGFYNVQGTDGNLIVNQAGTVDYGILYVQEGLNLVLPGTLSGKILAVATILFVFTGMMGYYYQAESATNYLFKGKKWAVIAIRVIFLSSIFSGVLMENESLWAMGDIGVGIMAWINIIAILLMCKQVKAIMKDFEEQDRLGVEPCFDPADFSIKDSSGAWTKYAEKKKDQINGKK